MFCVLYREEIKKFCRFSRFKLIHPMQQIRFCRSLQAPARESVPPGSIVGGFGKVVQPVGFAFAVHRLGQLRGDTFVILYI